MDKEKPGADALAAIVGGQHKPALSEQERGELFAKWEQKTLNAADEQRLRADFYRALLKSKDNPEAAKQESARATVGDIFRFYSEDLGRYALASRASRQGGGFGSGGTVEAVSRPSREQVLRAIRRELANKTPEREIARRVREGGITLSIRQIRSIGQTHALLPRRMKKGKR